jgi:hypothetical protein
LDALEKGEAENGGFVTKDVRVSPSIRLFRKVKAPILRGEPHLPGQTLLWSSHAQFVSQESTGWVQLGLALPAYGIECRLGNTLDVGYMTASLPTHNVWILVLDLVGRFARRSDGGKLPMQANRGVKSVQALPGRAIYTGRRPTTWGIKFGN